MRFIINERSGVAVRAGAPLLQRCLDDDVGVGGPISGLVGSRIKI